MTGQALPRMRTVAQIKAMFAAEGEAGISERELRRLAKSGAIPSLMAGRKLLINLDALIAYLNNACISSEQPYAGGIRRID